MLSLEFRGLFVSFLLVMVGKQRVMWNCNTLDWFSERPDRVITMRVF